MSEIGARAWQWVDTAGDVTSKFTLVRFGEGVFSDGTTETPFVYGEALIDEPVNQRYATLSGPCVGRPSVATRVDVVFYGTGQAPESALLDRAMCTLTAPGFSVSGMFLLEVTAGVTWRARAVAGGTAVVGVEAQIGPPPERGKETA